MTMAGNDLGGLLGGLLGRGGQAGGSTGSILGELLSAMSHAQSGGASNPLGGLIDMLAKSGLAEQQDSWVGTGRNQSVTGAQIQQALPDETIKHVAQPAGVTPDRAADALTPVGQVSSDTSLEDLIKQQSL
ncbi:YidB family protein [Streptomyces sp. NPDC001984]